HRGRALCVGVRIEHSGGDFPAAAGGLDPVDLGDDATVGNDVVEVVDFVAAGAGRTALFEQSVDVDDGLFGVGLQYPVADAVVRERGLCVCAGDGLGEVRGRVGDGAVRAGRLAACVVVPVGGRVAAGERVGRCAVVAVGVGGVLPGHPGDGLGPHVADAV